MDESVHSDYSEEFGLEQHNDNEFSDSTESEESLEDSRFKNINNKKQKIIEKSKQQIKKSLQQNTKKKEVAFIIPEFFVPYNKVRYCPFLSQLHY
jgi:hypothetical protein